MKDKGQIKTQSPVFNTDLAQFGDRSDTDSERKHQNMQQFNDQYSTTAKEQLRQLSY